jgi:hypothetical protein
MLYCFMLLTAIASTTTATITSAFRCWTRSGFVVQTLLFGTGSCGGFSSVVANPPVFPRKPVAAAGRMDSAIDLLDSVYGPVSSPNFPKPMPESEAGLCADGTQRRYLWTDAFAVLAYVSLADLCVREKKHEDSEKSRNAANTLVNVVHECLGHPRTRHRNDDVMARDVNSPTGFVGLRIGKLESRKVTDHGMRYDGMYWHYMDKWLFALARLGRVQDGIRIAKSAFPYFFDPGRTGGDGWEGGIRWKLSVDGTPPPSLERARASDDTLTALIVFEILQRSRTINDTTTDGPDDLSKEIQMLRKSLQSYTPRATEDPLGWGLEAIFDQYLAGAPRTEVLASLRHRALHPSHLSLPFRLYGAMIGARVAGEKVAPAAVVDQLIQLSLEHEEAAEARGFEEHSSINRVMLAMCLLSPGALGRRDGDPLISLE